MDVTRVLELEMFSGVGEVVLEDRCRAGRTLLLPRLAGGLRHAGALAAGGLQPRAALARKAVVDRRNRLPQRDCLHTRLQTAAVLQCCVPVQRGGWRPSAACGGTPGRGRAAGRGTGWRRAGRSGAGEGGTRSSGEP